MVPKPLTYKEGGQFWVTQPDTFYDFTILGSDLYVGTDRGVCKYPISTLQVDDCLNVYDGMPDWSTRTIASDGSKIYGGTNGGVGILTTNPFDVVDTWEGWRGYRQCTSRSDWGYCLYRTQRYWCSKV